MKTIRWIAVFLLMAMCLSALIACGEETMENTESSAGNEEQTSQPSEEQPPEEEKPILLDPSQAMILVESNKTDYVIVRDDAASNEDLIKISKFRDRFKTKTGANIEMVQDTAKEASKEIIISVMNGRAKTAQEYAKITAPEKKGYRIGIVGESIVVACTSEYLTEALELLEMAVCDCGNGIWGVPKEYEGKMDIPAFSVAGTMYNVGEGNYAYNVNNATKQMGDPYLTSLENDGFEIYSEHSIGNSQFATYVKDSIYGQMVVYTMYHPDIQKFRLTYGPMEYLPNVTKQSAASTSDPNITQMFMEMVYGSDKLTVSGSTITSNQNAPGMSYVIQLSDGRFIVIDGGSADGEVRTVTYDEAPGKWPISANTHQSSDAQRLYETMHRMKPVSHAKPRIAVWFLSHAHADHWNLAQNFLTDYKGKIELELLAFNFPEAEGGHLLASRVDRINRFKTTARDDYGANIWIMHTGQVMELPGASIEVLSTVEDYFCEGKAAGLTKEIDINNTCIVFRVNIGGMSFMVLGDAYQTTCQFMANAYGDALESDIMQLSHHGYNGAVLALYKAVDPKVCLWPCDEYAFHTDSVRLGTPNGSYSFNWWLRNNPWTRGTQSGARTHYATSYTTTIDVATGRAIRVA